MNRYNQVPYLTRYTLLESDKTQGNITHKKAKKVSPFPAGDHKAVWNRHKTLCSKPCMEFELFSVPMATK